MSSGKPTLRQNKVCKQFGWGRGTAWERWKKEAAELGRKRLWREDCWLEKSYAGRNGQALAPLLCSVISKGCLWRTWAQLGRVATWQIPPWREIWVVGLCSYHKLSASPWEPGRLFAVNATVLSWERKMRFSLTWGRLHKEKALKGPAEPSPDFIIFYFCNFGCKLRKTQLKMVWTINIYCLILRNLEEGGPRFKIQWCHHCVVTSDEAFFLFWHSQHVSIVSISTLHGSKIAAAVLGISCEQEKIQQKTDPIFLCVSLSVGKLFSETPQQTYSHVPLARLSSHTHLYTSHQ